ncbi:MAG: hypothetical protein KJ950_14490 [Proteobacteria bacterium]|nr:hypothetical protein [Pseudomonadota bacterium]MBU1688885.1 hypothetical protein [Pseudomonadota bacterium]
MSSYRRGHPSTRPWPLLALARLLIPIALLSSTGANANDVKSINTMTVDPLMDQDATIMFLAENFTQLPEKQISISEDSTVYAQYAQPTARYTHGILGDTIEAEQLVVLKNGTIYTQTVTNRYVFEDIKPRLFDVDNDGQMEIVTIRTHIMRGAGIMIYKLKNTALTEFAWVE